MERTVFVVPALHCSHCTHTIQMELEELNGVSSVKADLNSKEVMVEYQPPATKEMIVNILKEINYPPEQG